MFPFARLHSSTPFIEGDGLVLRCPRRSDYLEWRTLRIKSRAFLTPFEPAWDDNELSARNFSARVRRIQADADNGTDFVFFLFSRDGRRQTLVGGITLSNIRRRAAQNVTLGYWMGVDYAGKGIMTRAVALILPFVFDTLRLHRIEAACLPDNWASRRVLSANGFREIGLAENYLRINGDWRDHVLFAMTLEHYNQLSGDTA